MYYAILIHRIEQPTEWPSSPAHEGPVCWAVSDRSGPPELPPALPAHVDGPPGVRPQWLPNAGQPGTPYPRALCGQPPAGLPVRPHTACQGRTHAGQRLFFLRGDAIIIFVINPYNSPFGLNFHFIHLKKDSFYPQPFNWKVQNKNTFSVWTFFMRETRKILLLKLEIDTCTCTWNHYNLAYLM